MKIGKKYDLKIKLRMKSKLLYSKGSPSVSARVGVILGLLLKQEVLVHSFSVRESFFLQRREN